jgi:hypothetical protein
LLHLWSNNQDKFASLKTKTKSAWQNITTDLNIQGHSFTTVQVKSKWKNLTKYRDNIDNNNTSGNEKKTCSYFKELSEIYGYRPNVNTEATISSSSTSTSTASASSNSIEAQSDHDSDAENPERKKKTTLTRKRKSTGNGMIETMNKIHEENKNTQKEKNWIIQVLFIKRANKNNNSDTMSRNFFVFTVVDLLVLLCFIFCCCLVNKI